MENEKLVKILTELCQLDIDSVAAYDIALDAIEDPEIFGNLIDFKLDHIQHISELNNYLLRLGSKDPTHSLDLKGYLLSGITALKSWTGLLGALKAMANNEEKTNEKYLSALNNNPDLPLDAKELLKKNATDEKVHLAYIQGMMKVISQGKNNHSS